MKKMILGIMVIIAIMGLTACDNKKEVNPVPEVNNSENVIEKNETPRLTDEEMYESVINEYRNANNEFSFENVDGEETITNKYKMVSITLIEHVARYKVDGVKLTYGFYDIDNNGINELIVGADGSIGAIYSYDSNTNSPTKVFFQETMERGNLHIYDNGIILSDGAGGAALHYYEFGKLSSDGVSYELLESIEEEYIEGNETPVYREYPTGNALEYNSIDEVMNKYIANAKVVEDTNNLEM